MMSILNAGRLYLNWVMRKHTDTLDRMRYECEHEVLEHDMQSLIRGCTISRVCVRNCSRQVKLF